MIHETMVIQMYIITHFPGVIFSIICSNHGRLWMNHRDCCVCCFFTAQLYLGLFVVGLWYYRDFLKCILYINWISALCMLPRYLTRFFTRWEVHRTFFRNYAYGIAVYILEDISGKKRRTCNWMWKNTFRALSPIQMANYVHYTYGSPHQRWLW